MDHRHGSVPYVARADPPVFSHHRDLILSPINSYNKESSKHVVYDVGATERTVLVAMSFVLSARDDSMSAVASNEVSRGYGPLFPFLDLLAQ